MEQCNGCRFWLNWDSEGTNLGECHRFPPQVGTRSVIKISVERISDSCGYGVPLMTYVGERGELGDWVKRKTEEELVEYRRKKNATSIDGLPGLSE